MAHMVRAIAVLLSLVTIAGCADDGDDVQTELPTEQAQVLAAATCPTAPENWPLSLFWWKTTRQIENFVWTSDGSRLLGSELRFEEKKSWDPLAGTTLKRKFCHQLFLIDVDGTDRQDLGAAAPLQAGEMFAFPAAGYVVAELAREGARDWVRVGSNGSRRPLATIEGDCTWGRVVPSPDGSHIAVVRTTQACNDGGVESAVEVAFLNAAGDPVSTPVSIDFDHFATTTWTPAGTLVATDGAAAFAVSVTGAVTPAPVPGCTEPPTASSEVDAAGRIVEVVDGGRPGIVGTDRSRAFGCQ